ncbi:MAG: FapA family protein [bacterium]|nr:FapA family protein [bacterium]
MADQISMTISGDGLQVTVEVIGPKTTGEEVAEALCSHGITHGIQSQLILEAIDTAKKSGRPVSDVLVAEGTPPKATVPTRVEHRPRGQEEALPSLKSVQTLLNLENPKEIEKATEDVEVLAVKKGDLLAVKILGTFEPGKSVKGDPIDKFEDEGEQNPQLQPGFGVELSSDEYRATAFGYVGILDGKVAVLPPIWVASDDMAACYVSLPLVQGSAQPDLGDISEALAAAGITAGIVETSVQALSDKLARQDLDQVLNALAVGVAPEEPVDAVPEFSFAHESQAGAVREDGSIDLKDRQRFPSVVKGDLLVSCQPPVSGTPGLTVKGEEIEIREPIAVELEAGEHVRSSKNGDVQQLFSEMDGGVGVQMVETSTESVTLHRYTISVRSLAEISGDVDYETGNIDFKGNVEIKGKVVGGFTVKATGDIVVLEGVEDGAEIRGDGNLTVKQGIVGSKTKVVVKGGVTAKFIQDASIQAGGDVVAESYIRTATIQTKTNVTVEGGGATGGIFGGKTWALKSVAAKNLGSERSTTTTLFLGVVPEIFEAYAELTKQADKANDSREALLKVVGVTELKAEEIQKAMLRNPDQKNEILRYVSKANEYAKKQMTALEGLKMMRVDLKNSALDAHLDVTGTCHARVKIRIGNLEKVLEKDVKAVRFHLGKKKEEKGVVCTNLSEVGKEE